MRLDKLAKVKDLQLKQLRERGSSAMRAELGFPTEVISMCLNHAPQGVTQIHYASKSNEVLKSDAFEAWAGFLREK